jgi:dolichol-phosphate mannosyltransferase
MIDGDGQHPVESIPHFIEAWQKGGQVVIGVSVNRKNKEFLKRLGSKVFYFLINHLSSQKLTPGLTDFRLIDNSVQKAFIGLKENDRVTRGLIDWLGFKRVFVEYKENRRKNDQPGYGYRGLINLATNSILSLTLTPLYIFGLLGIFITIGSFLLGGAVIIEQLIMDDPLNWNFTGTAMLGILILFMVGIILMSQGVLSLYVSRLSLQSKGRPLYVIDYTSSAGIKHEI